MIRLEVCANSIQSAIAAQNGGAFRVELCTNLQEGGTTPSLEEIQTARKLLKIQLYVLLRPRSGNFVYSDAEFETIKRDIITCAETGCDGIVAGILNADGTIDKPRCAQLVHLARQYGLGTTFHRAFDVCADQFQALEDIIELGFDRILTSGGKDTATEGAGVITGLAKQAAGRISIMPGSGINENNVAELVRISGVNEVHSSARVADITDELRVKNIIKMAYRHIK